MITLQERVHGASKPSDWHLDKLHQVFRVRRGNKNTGMKEDNLLSLSYGRIIQKDIDTEDGLLPDNFEGYQIVEPGNIVLRLTDLQNDKRSLRQGLVTQLGIITSAYDAVEVQRDNDARFWFYSLLALDLAKHYYSLGGGVRQSVKFADFPNDWVYRPDLATQRQIANFLDRETARIDLLIEKKQRLVALLGEKVATQLSRAVRGFLTSSDAERSKGIDWMDGFPKHWTRMPLKALGHGNNSVFIDGDWIESKDLSDSGIRYLTTGNVGLGFYKEQGAGFITPETFEKLNCTEVLPGDILISRLNPPIGRACIVPDLGTRIVTSVDNVIVRPDHHFDRGFIVHILSSREHFENTSNIARGTTMQRISRSALGNIRIPVPPLAEQHEISRQLDRHAQQYHHLAKAIFQSIDRLKEYRSALITAAVTGQIDVRTYAKSDAPDRRLDAIQEEMGA